MTESLVKEAGIKYELSSPEVFGTFVAAEIARWAKVVKDNRIQPE